MLFKAHLETLLKLEDHWTSDSTSVPRFSPRLDQFAQLSDLLRQSQTRRVRVSFKALILSGDIFFNIFKLNNKKYTFKTAGATELGPRDENTATLVDNGFPSSVLEGLSFANGDLHPATKSIH